MATKITTEIFIERARKVHGDKYDYSKVEYVNNNKKVCITCPNHGDFFMAPAGHWKGNGCPKCSKERTLKKNVGVALRKIEEVLNGTGYEIVNPFIYKGDRGTIIRLYCTTHDFSWNIQYHQLVFDYDRKNKYCGCKYCKIIYSKEVCHSAALKCKSRSEFARRFKGEYFAAMRNEWLDDICSHMKPLGNRYKRCIYVYEFLDIDGFNYAYVGLTDNLAFRDKVHARKGAVYKFCRTHNLVKPTPKQLTDYIDKEEAKKLEGEYLHKYIQKGWLPINIAKTGGLGGHLRFDGFTYQQCLEIGKRYTKRSDWKQQAYSSYYIADKLGWLDTILPRNERHGNATRQYWTKDRVAATAAKYKYIKDFREAEPTAYQRALKFKWMDEACGHMKRLLEETGFTVGSIKEEIEKYETLTDFIIACPRMYNWLSKHKIKLADISDKTFRKPKKFQKPIAQFDLDGNLIRTYDNARQTEQYGFSYKKVSLVCNGKSKIHRGFIFKFISPQDNEEKWTYEKCKLEASKYRSRSEFKLRNAYACRRSREAGWLDEFFPKKEKK